MFEMLQSSNILGSNFPPEFYGFLVGGATQALTAPLFKFSLANHNYKICDSSSLKEFYRKSFNTNQGRLGFFTNIPLSLIIRGGVLGMIQQGIFFRAIEFLEEPHRLPGGYLSNPDSHKARIDHFMNSVQDDCAILEKLHVIGYFDEIIYDQNIKPPRQYKNILICGIAVSLLQSLIMTPIDLLVYNQMQLRMYGPKVLKNVGLRQVYQEIKNTQGLQRIGTMVFASSFVRNLFIVSGFYLCENYLRSQIINE